MITYFTKQFQAVPALMGVHQGAPGHFVTTRTNTRSAIKKLNPQASVTQFTEKLGSWSAGYHILNKAELIVTGAPYSNVLKKFNAKKYMIFTGTSPALTSKQIREDHAHFDVLCAIGPRMMRVIERSGVNTEYVMAGYFPFLSYPAPSEWMRSNLLTSIKLNPDFKTVVYLPRGEPTGSLDIMLPKLVEALDGAPFNLVVRPHPSQSVKLHIRDRFKFALLNKRLSQYSNIFLDLNVLKLSELLASADLVISDANSPAEEALFYDMPQMLVETSRLSRAFLTKRMRGHGSSEEDIHLAMRIYDNGPILSPETQNILNAIEKAIAEASVYKLARQENFKFVFGDRGFENQEAMIERIRAFQDG